MNDASVWAEPLMAMLFSKQTVTAGVGIRSPVRCHGGERGVLSGNVLHVPPKKNGWNMFSKGELILYDRRKLQYSYKPTHNSQP